MGDVDRLAGHLGRLAADRPFARRAGAASRARAARFSWDAVTAAYLALFEAVAAGPGAPAPAAAGSRAS